MTPDQQQIEQAVRNNRTALSAQLRSNALRPVDATRARRNELVLQGVRTTWLSPTGLADLEQEEQGFIDAIVRQRRAQEAGERAPDLAPFLADPDYYARINDDLEPLSVMGAEAAMLETQAARRRGMLVPEYRQWVASQDRYAGISPRLRATATAQVRPNATLLSTIAALPVQALSAIDRGLLGIGQNAAELVGADQTAQGIARASEQSRLWAYRNTPLFENRDNQAIFGGVTSALTLAPALGASVITRSPTPVLAWAGGMSYGESYSTYRAQGAGVGASMLGATGNAGVEVLTELLPAKYLTDALGRTGTGRLIVDTLIRDLGGEQAATALQDAIDVAMPGSNMSWEDYWRMRPERARETLVSTLTQTALFGGVNAVMRRALQNHESEEALNSIDTLMDAAGNSKVRAEHPALFRELVDRLLQNRDAETVYVDPAKVRELFQSENELRQDAFWGPRIDALNEAEAAGHDMAMSMADVATALAGSPQWEALKDQVRPGASDATRSEIDEANAAFEQALQEAAEEASASIDAENAAAAPVQRVYEAMRDKFMLAGHRPDVASHLAALFAQRQRTRAERLGEELTGEEAGAVEVRRQLPARLGSVIAKESDVGLRSVINELRRGRGERSERSMFGPSLLDFIRSRGGVSDPGGDIRAMGAQEIGGRKKGAERIIGLQSLDDIALAAWEAGYFPELGERPTVNDMLIAISESISGRQRYASDVVEAEDELRMAAQELLALLDQAGLDIQTAPAEDIQKVVQQYQAEFEQGRAFEQTYEEGGARGRVTFTTDGRSVIDLFAKSDMSTAIHEMGHIFLEELRFDAAAADTVRLYRAEGDRRNSRQGIDTTAGRLWFTTDPKIAASYAWKRNGEVFFIDLPSRRAAELLNGGITANVPEAEAFGMQQFTRLGLMRKTAMAEGTALTPPEVEEHVIASLPVDTRQQLKDDWQAVQDWFAASGVAIDESGAIPTDAHEMWARGFERFAMEGKSPSGVLRRAFDAFRSWLLTIYQVVENLRSPISPEIRDVMSRLLATEQEIETAREEQGLKALFDSAEAAGMSEEDFAAYTATAQQARDEAFDALLYRTMRTIRAARTKEWKEQEASVRGEVSADVDGQPVFRALRALRTGQRLSKRFLIDTYGPEALDAMPRSVPPVYVDQGAHPDAIAEEVGYPSGDAMVRALMGLEETRKRLREAGDKRSPRQVAIDQGTADQMAARYGDPLRDGSIEEEALAAVHTEKQGELIEAELKALSRQRYGENDPRAGRVTPYQMAKRWAKERVKRGKVSEVASGSAIQVYQRAARKAAKEAESAIANRDLDEAYRQKQRQMLNNALVSEARKAQETVEVAVRRLSRTAARRTAKSIDQDYLEQAHALLERYDFSTRSVRDVQKQIAFEEWADQRREEGYDVLVPPRWQDRLGQRHWSQLSVEEIVGLDDSVKQVLHLGRLKQKLLDGAEQRDFEEAVGELVASAGGIGKQRNPPNDLDPDRSFLGATGSKLRGIDAAMVKIEAMAGWLDGGSTNGPWNRLIFKPLADAQGREGDLMRDYTKRLNALVDAMPKAQAGEWNRRVETPELINNIEGHPGRGEPWSFHKDQVIMLALNWGNEGNRQRLLDGYRWQPQQVEAVFDRLMNADDWKFVQGVWDLIDGLWEPLAALERRVNGVEPEKVEAIEVVTRHGTFSGGYFPAVYDSSLRTAPQRGGGEDLLEGGYIRATTRAGASKERTGNDQPILLNMSVITRHLFEVIHDITHREALTQTWKVVSDPKVRRAVTNALGPEYADILRPWLRHIANDYARNANSNSTIMNIFRRIRLNVTIVGLGFRLTSVVAQIAGMPAIIGRIGVGNMAAGWSRFLANPRAAYQEVTSKSAEMRDRFSTMDRDVLERSRMMQGKGVRAIKGPMWLTRYAFHGIVFMDAILTTAGWIGAYRKATAEKMSEEEAVYYADQTIRRSQGAGGAKDQAAIMRDNEATRLFTMFFSYFSALYNEQRTLGHDLRRATSAKEAGTVAYRAFWIVAMAHVMDGVIRAWMTGEGPEDKDKDGEIGWDEYGIYLARRVLTGNMASLPGVRDIVSAMDSGYGYSVSPIGNIGDTAVNVFSNLKKAFDGDEDTQASSKWLKQTLTLLGLATGTPTGQIANAAQFGRDVAAGDAEPESVGDWARGLSTGKLEEE